MLSEDRKYSGMALKFEENVDEIILRTMIENEDGALERPMIFTPGDVALAQMGPNGFVTVHEGSTFNGHVTFLIGKVNQAQKDPTAPNYESETMRLSKLPGYDYPELRKPPTEQSLIERIEEALDAGKAVPPLVYVEPTEYDEDGLKCFPQVTVGPAPEAVVGHSPAQRDHSGESVPEGFASQVLKTVRDRGSDYGTPAENHQLTADLWGAWLSRRMKTTIKMSAEDVCLLNVIQKLSRLASKTKDDSLLDLAGYAENVAMLSANQRNV